MRVALIPLVIASVMAVPAERLGAQLLLDEQVIEIQNVSGARGWREVESPQYREIRAGAAELFVVDLDDDEQYMIWGVCDEDCTDINFRLSKYDGGGTVASHTGPDTPVMGPLIVEDNGTYAIEVDMVTCRAQTCRVAILVFY